VERAHHDDDEEPEQRNPDANASGQALLERCPRRDEQVKLANSSLRDASARCVLVVVVVVKRNSLAVWKIEMLLE